MCLRKSVRLEFYLSNSTKVSMLKNALSAIREKKVIIVVDKTGTKLGLNQISTRAKPGLN